MYYSIRHLTRYRYTAPISESAMLVRMRPLTEGPQRCLEFTLETDPRTQITYYRDFLGNTVHNFNVPGRHVQLTLTAESLVELSETPGVPDILASSTWEEIDALAARGEYLDWLLPSKFARPSELLDSFTDEIGLQRGPDPMTTLRELNTLIYNTFAYVPHTTTVDSPIEDALKVRRGVCQDFAHIMITLVRKLGIPCRYVSGYLYHRKEDHDRSEEDATHAWVEAYLPEIGWLGFDPTNNLIVYDRHIRTAIGRDYADVPPTYGVFRGAAESELDVGVRVAPAKAPPPVDDEELLPAVHWSPPDPEEEERSQQQQQQQQ